ncbi:hypothetical protein Syun_021652 [Stephania yunnanensis]|uniref:Cytochrome P450 n=1 Tax=Stephania yunnanensis TaxID=152371 RepID=A0AAP0IGS6_9MAGN
MLFFKTHDAVFASRPKTQFGKYISYGNKGVVPAQYGLYWRSMRRLCTTELLTNAKIEMFKDVRGEELRSLVEELKVAANAGEVVDVSEKVDLLVEDMVYRMFFGKKDYQLMDSKVNLREGLWLAGSFNLIDFLPFLAPFDIQGLTHRNKSFGKDLDRLLMTIIDDHEKHPRGNQRDIIDIMLSLMDSNNAKDVQFDLVDIKAIVTDLILAGIDISATTILWAFSEVMKRS